MNKPDTESQATLDVYGIDYDSFGVREKAAWNRQERFLAAYATVGTITKAAVIVECHVETVRLWRSGDMFSFRQRFETAQQQYAEHLEGTMFSRIDDPTGNRGSDVLLIFAIKGALREKYGDAVILSDDSAKDVLKQLQARRTKRTTAEDEEPEIKAPTPIEAMRERAQGDGA